MKQLLSSRWYLGLFFWIISFSWSLSMNAATLSPAELTIEQASTQLKTRMQDPAFTKDFGQITEFVKSVIYPKVDFDKVSSLVLGKHWKTASEDEKKRFKQEFQLLIIRSYSRAFTEFKEWSVKFLPLETTDNPDKVVVKTEIIQPGLQPIAISYKMAQNKGEWKAYDITIEGVSLVTNYRSSFNADIERSGSLTSVIEDLAKRNKEALTAKDQTEKSPS